MTYNTILETVGKTPLVKLNRVGSDLQCNLFAKCEFFNPGGSVKDRIALRMVEEAEKEGRIKPGDTLIEPTSGNTGIGLALVGAVKGYNILITMPEKMSREKQVVLESLGAKIIRTPTEAAWDAPESHIGVAKKLQKELPNAHILDQYANPANPDAHYYGTGQEIVDEFKGQKIDMVVIGAGTGGTITGTAKKIKEVYPDCIVVGADPIGSILAGGTDVGSYLVEGIGYDFIPDVLDRDIIDRWVKTDDQNSFTLSRRLIIEEGLLCGGSSGSAMSAALKEAATLKAGQNCVILLPDGVRNYMTKFVDNNWMKEHRFNNITIKEGKVKDLLENKSAELFCLKSEDTADKAVNLMKKQGFSQIPITNNNNKIVGVLHEKHLLESLLSGQSSKSSKLSSIMQRNFSKVDLNTAVSSVQELLLDASSVIVIDEKDTPVQILTKIDLVDWITN